MKTPITKPFKQGKGAVVRFENDEMDAVIEAIGEGGGELAQRIRGILQKARADNEVEIQTHRRHMDTIHPLSQIRLGMRGWALVSQPSNKIELYVRQGDFLLDVQGSNRGWQYGVSGAFEGETNVLRGAWQACLFSRRNNAWLFATERPTSNDEASALGHAALKERKAGLGRAGNSIESRSFAGCIGKIDVSHHYRQQLQHHGGGEQIGTVYSNPVRLVHARAIVKIVVGFYETTHNHRWHPTYDIWAVPNLAEHGHAERTGPFWCASAPVWTIAVDGQSDQSLLHPGFNYEPTMRDNAIFKVFATRAEAIAYAGSLTTSLLGRERRMIHMAVEAPASSLMPLATPFEEAQRNDVFAQAA